MEFIIQDALKNSEANMFKGVPIGQASIKVVGVGGAGCNAANWLYKKGVKGAEIIVTNTDKQHLDMMEVPQKLLLGKSLTRGLGCGGYLEKGREATHESMQDVKEMLRGSDMVFITAGMGGGTGTGGASVVAQVARDNGCIVIGVVTMPFSIERARIDKAEFGLQQLRQVSDSVVVIDNNRLVSLAGNLPVEQAFAVANELMSTMIKGIVETIAVPCLVNLDYADVKAIMTQGGVCAIGVGESDTENRVKEAVKRALSNPLLDISYEGASGALINICGGDDLTLDEVNKIGETVTQALDPDANVIWGASVTPGMRGKLRVMTIIAGVSSPYILGKTDHRQPIKSAIKFTTEELGLDFVR